MQLTLEDLEKFLIDLENIEILDEMDDFTKTVYYNTLNYQIGRIRLMINVAKTKSSSYQRALIIKLYPTMKNFYQNMEIDLNKICAL